MSSTPVKPKSEPAKTKKLVGPIIAPEISDTEFDLSQSTILPTAERLALPPSKRQVVQLDATARELFRQRLRLCCLIAILPFSFLLASGLTNFIELYGSDIIGKTGVGLCAFTIMGLLGVAIWLSRKATPTEATLRVLEIAVFGVMALFFAYWQFAVLTADPARGFEGDRHERTFVLAATVTAHFNWFVLIVFHGVLVPNSAARGLGVAAGMCVGAVGIDIIAALLHEPTARAASAVFAVSITMLAAAAGLSIFGTAKTAALRREVESAREAVRQLGQYRLRRKLGSGGMGEVYLAEHQLLKRPCALKRIHAKYLNNPEQVARFQREVQATAQLRHPNTVEIYDYGVAEDGTFFYVMEYLPGLSLEDLVARYGPQQPARVVYILKQVCGALREAHRHGLVHRDIKPSNILVFAEGSPHDHVKLVDFGLVQSLVWGGGRQEKITREGLIVGTPEYMSPEQASGGELDGRSDIFSLGSVAYFLLTGREAFHRDNPMKTLLAVVTDAPQPIAELNPFVPHDLASVLAQSLAKDLMKRFRTAYDMEIALDACECSAEWTEKRSVEWWQAHPGAAPVTGTDLSSLMIVEDATAMQVDDAA